MARRWWRAAAAPEAPRAPDAWPGTLEVRLWHVLVLVVAVPVVIAAIVSLCTLNFAGGYGFTVWPEEDEGDAGG